MRQWFKDLDWYRILFPIGIVVMIGGLIWMAVYAVARDNKWEDACYAKGGLVVDTGLQDDQACIDSERKLILP